LRKGPLSCYTKNEVSTSLAKKELRETPGNSNKGGIPMGARNDEPRNPEDILKQMQDRAILLGIAGEYLCEVPFLKTVGASTAQELEVLRNHINGLMGKSKGKAYDERILNKQLERIARLAEQLETADDNTLRKCIQGEVGRELGQRTKALRDGITEIRASGEGRPVTYTWVDSILGILGKLKTVFDSLTRLSKLGIKILGVVIFFCLVAFCFLFFTMESQNDLLERMAQHKTRIYNQQGTLSKIQAQLKETRKKVAALEQEELNRAKEIELIELNLNVFALVQQQEKTELELRLEEKEWKEGLRRLEEMRKKSLWERLLRL
jgi:hypothetical protein